MHDVTLYQIEGISIFLDLTIIILILSNLMEFSKMNKINLKKYNLIQKIFEIVN